MKRTTVDNKNHCMTTKRPSAVKPFTGEQNYFIAHGKKNMDRLSLITRAALGIVKKKYEVKRHTYIYSPPGAGKTFTVQAAADAAKVKLIKVPGGASMNAFITQIATAAFSMPPRGDLIVWVDDCDSLFMDEESVNVMKGAMDEERNVLSWNKNLTMQIMGYEKSDHPNDQLKAAALRHYQIEGGVGIVIPTDRIRFIVTSNKNLCPPADVFTRKGSKKMNMHEGALRDRVNYEEFELSENEAWGWVAAVLMGNKVLDLTQGQKQILLDWMWSHWDKLPAKSMRAVKDYAALMLNHPGDYPDYWNATLRKVK